MLYGPLALHSKGFKISTSLCFPISSRKYAAAKRCATNATLTLCKVTTKLLDQVNFIYDSFNPFCFNLSDPPLAEKSRELGERIPRKSGLYHDPFESKEHTTGSDIVYRGGGGHSMSTKPSALVVVMALFILRAVVS